MNTTVTRLILCATITLSTISPASAQLAARAHNLTVPRVSPQATVSQNIGLSTVTISYHRPGVKEREIWGTQLAPYDGKPFPWRAGANENTTIAFSHDAKINGTSIAAGTYGFHTIPTASDWILIFSKNHTSWGSFFYNAEEDALRITVRPEENPHIEWLAYGFENLTPNSASAYLAWEKLKVRFDVEFDAHEIALTSIRDQLRSVPAFTWQGWYQAAEYCHSNNINTEEAMAWIEESLKRQENDMNLGLKGKMLAKAGKTEEARKALNKALEIAPAKRKGGIEKALEAL